MNMRRIEDPFRRKTNITINPDVLFIILNFCTDDFLKKCCHKILNYKFHYFIIERLKREKYWVIVITENFLLEIYDLNNVKNNPEFSYDFKKKLHLFNFLMMNRRDLVYSSIEFNCLVSVDISTSNHQFFKYNCTNKVNGLYKLGHDMFSVLNDLEIKIFIFKEFNEVLVIKNKNNSVMDFRHFSNNNHFFALGKHNGTCSIITFYNNGSMKNFNPDIIDSKFIIKDTSDIKIKKNDKMNRLGEKNTNIEENISDFKSKVVAIKIINQSTFISLNSNGIIIYFDINGTIKKTIKNEINYVPIYLKNFSTNLIIIQNPDLPCIMEVNIKQYNQKLNSDVILGTSFYDRIVSVNNKNRCELLISKYIKTNKLALNVKGNKGTFNKWNELSENVKIEKKINDSENEEIEVKYINNPELQKRTIELKKKCIFISNIID